MIHNASSEIILMTHFLFKKIKITFCKILNIRILIEKFVIHQQINMYHTYFSGILY